MGKGKVTIILLILLVLVLNTAVVGGDDYILPINFGEVKWVECTGDGDGIMIYDFAPPHSLRVECLKIRTPPYPQPDLYSKVYLPIISGGANG